MKFHKYKKISKAFSQRSLITITNVNLQHTYFVKQKKAFKFSVQSVGLVVYNNYRCATCFSVVNLFCCFYSLTFFP